MAIKYLDSKRIRGKSVNSSAFFDGTDDYVTAPATILSGVGTGIFSMAMWIRKTANSNALIRYTTGNYWEIDVNGSGKLEYASNTNRVIDTVLADATWYHIVVERDGSDIISIWVDGVEETLSDSTADTVSFSGDIKIGGAGTWTGNIQDMVITSDLLTAGEISDLAGGKTVAQVNPDNQTVHYPFMVDFTDSSGNARNGTASGSVITATNGRGDDKATLATDSLGSAADGTNSGAVSNSATAIYGKESLIFTSDTVNLGNDLDVLTTASDGFTFTCWAYFENATASGHKTIISKPAVGSWTGNLYHSFTVQHASGTTNVELVVNDGSTYRSITVASGGVGWHFITVTKTSGNVFVLKVDDNSSATMTYSPTWGTQDWVIGETQTQSRYWDGKIQDVAFWSRVLTGAEQTALFTNNATPAVDYDNSASTTSTNTGKVATSVSQTGLKAYYTFNDATTGVTNSANVFNLPENTLFEETDTYKTYWLQDNEWKINDLTIGCTCVGDDGGNSSLIDYVTIDTAGDAETWGNATQARFDPATFADATHGIIAGGGISASQNTIDYFAVAVPATNSTDWGDLITAVKHNVGVGDETTYGLSCGGHDGNYTDKIERITIATTGSAANFGDLAPSGLGAAAGCSDGTYGYICGGYES